MSIKNNNNVDVYVFDGNSDIMEFPKIMVALQNTSYFN